MMRRASVALAFQGLTVLRERQSVNKRGQSSERRAKCQGSTEEEVTKTAGGDQERLHMGNDAETGS